MTRITKGKHITAPIKQPLFPLTEKQAAPNDRMTAVRKPSKVNRPSEREAPMKILLVAQAGLLADAFAGSLTKLAPVVQVHRCEMGELEKLNAAAASPQLVVIEIDDMVGNGATAVRTTRALYATAPIVALVGKIDEAYIPSIMDAGAQAYLSKSCSEAHALGVLHAAVNGLGATPEPTKTATDAVAPFVHRAAAQQPSGDHPYGLTDRQLEVLAMPAKACPICRSQSGLASEKAQSKCI